MSERVNVDDVARYFEGGQVRALDGVSFAAGSDIVAVTGPSGCGKSTLLSLVGLLDAPSRGRVLIEGEDVARLRAASEFRARRIGFVFQHHYMVPTMTILENVAAPMIALGVRKAARLDRAAALIDAVGLTHRAHALPANVSGGERQRAAVARALVNGAHLVLADEPTGNLDSANGHRVMELLVHHMRAAGGTLIIATHNADIVAACDRVLTLRDGRLAGAAEPLRLERKCASA
jgi:putative ABC transport system ATP-binding protein